MADHSVLLTVAYDGRPFSGWAPQDGARTVAGELLGAIRAMDPRVTEVRGASRTDAGVHARGQVASFRTERTIPLHGVRRGLNSLLPDTIAIREADEVDDAFHPRFSATGKHYRYTILVARDRSPRWRHRAWFVSDPLDVDAMRAAATYLVGQHEFDAFRAAGCAAKTTRRTIESITIGHADETLIVDVRGNAFLRNMVRIVVGTVVEVGVGRWPPAQVAEILAAKDRTQAGITAPAHGLELVEVRYDGRRPAAVSPDEDSR